MKVAIPSEGPSLKSSISRRLGTGVYFFLADLEAEILECVECPFSEGNQSLGVQAVVFILGHDVDVLLTGYCSPAIRGHLENNGVKVYSGLSGSVGELLEEYKRGRLEKGQAQGQDKVALGKGVGWTNIKNAALRTRRQISSMLPIMAGVVLLVGLFNGFVSKEFVASVFSGNVILDTFLGAWVGSVFAGNPINSYVIGGELLKQGVSLFAVTAFMLTWSTVGLVQLPAEMSALGQRFAILRNVVCFVLSFPIAMATVFILNRFFDGSP